MDGEDEDDERERRYEADEDAAKPDIGLSGALAKDDISPTWAQDGWIKEGTGANEKGANIYGWHAFTESLRDEEERKKGITNNQVTLRDDIGIPKGSTLITGGTCAAMRAIGIMHTMGFRYFDLFGYDSCMEEPTAEQKKETTGAEDEEPRPKYFEVGVKDKKFWTTGELLAMAQDCERTFADTSMGINFVFHGKDTLVSALWELSQNIKKKQPNFERDFA